MPLCVKTVRESFSILVPFGPFPFIFIKKILYGELRSSTGQPQRQMCVHAHAHTQARLLSLNARVSPSATLCLNLSSGGELE